MDHLGAALLGERERDESVSAYGSLHEAPPPSDEYAFDLDNEAAQEAAAAASGPHALRCCGVGLCCMGWRVWVLARSMRVLDGLRMHCCALHWACQGAALHAAAPSAPRCHSCRAQMPPPSTHASGDSGSTPQPAVSSTRGRSWALTRCVCRARRAWEIRVDHVYWNTARGDSPRLALQMHTS